MPIDIPTDDQLNQWRRLGPLGKLHNIVVWILGSPQRIQAFKHQSNDLMPHRDNGTRWNSWYDMLDWAIERIKPAVVAVSNDEPDLANDLLTAEEWKVLCQICDFLKGFHNATKATEGRRATLDRILPTMDFLADRFEGAIDRYSYTKFMRESVQSGFTKLLKYWNKTDRSPAYIAAIVLDPTVKWTYFESWDATWQPNMKAKLREFWELTYRSSTGLIDDTSPTRTSTVEDTDNEYFQWMNQKRGVRVTDTNDELDR